jgi:hypothetical protein
MVIGKSWVRLARRAESVCDFILTLYTQVSANKRLFHIDMLDLDLHIVGLTIRLLCSSKLATRLEEGGR